MRSIDAATRTALVEIGTTPPMKLMLGDLRLAASYAYSNRGRRLDGRTGFGVVELVEHAQWVPPFHIEYRVGIDGLSLPLVVALSFIFLLACIASWKLPQQSRGYFVVLLIMETSALARCFRWICFCLRAFSRHCCYRGVLCSQSGGAHKGRFPGENSAFSASLPGPLC